MSFEFARLSLEIGFFKKIIIPNLRIKPFDLSLGIGLLSHIFGLLHLEFDLLSLKFGVKVFKKFQKIGS